MRLPVIFICAALLISSCNKATGIKTRVAGSDSVAISYYKGDGSMDSVSKVVILKDRKVVESLADFIESGNAANTPCGYDGALHFFKDNQVIQQVDFRKNDPNCMHFSFSLDGKSWYTHLSPEASQFLESAGKR